MVYEANARIRDPVYGCAGAIFQLQKQLSLLQSQLAMAQAEIFNMQTQQADMVALLLKDMQPQEPISPPSDSLADDDYQLQLQQGYGGFFDDANINGLLLEPLWT